MPQYSNLKQFVLDFIGQLTTVYGLEGKESFSVNRVSESGISMTRLSNNENDVLSVELLMQSLSILMEHKTLKASDIKDGLSKEQRIISLFSYLPFTEVESMQHQTIRLKQLTTQDLPERFNQSMSFIAEDKHSFDQSPFFHIVYEMIKVMSDYDLSRKKDILLEMMYIIVSSSTQGTMIKESVAEERLKNTLRWLEEMGEIDNELNITNRELAFPFNNIFDNYSQARRVFSVMNDMVKKLGLNSDKDERLAITYVKKHQSIHINFGNWLIGGYDKKIRF